MSLQPEEAVARLGESLSSLVPTLLDRIAALRAATTPAALLPPAVVFDELAPLASDPSAKDAFALSPPSDPAHAEDHTRLRNLCLEVGSNQLRDVVYQVAKPPALPQAPMDAVQQQLGDDVLRSIIDRLDMVLSLALSGLVDTALPLTLVEELLELNTVPTCSQLFAYIESRVKQLTVDLHPTRGKGLVLLRLCNELLRRLSKPSQRHTVFAGRILSLLAAVFPLGERSGVNLRGDFNVENRTILEDADASADDDTPPDAKGSTETAGGDDKEDDKAAAIKLDPQMYDLFWGMQRFFSNPPLLMGLQDSSRQSSRTATPAPAATSADGDDQAGSEEDPAPDGAKGSVAELRISTKKILALFAAVAKREKELAGAAAAEGNSTNGSSASSSNGAKTPAGTLKQAQGQVTGYRAGQDTGDSAQLVSQSEGGDPSRKRKRYEPDLKNGIKTRVVTMEASMAVEGDDAEMAGDDEENDVADGARDSDIFFPKFLTGRKLLEYEIRDPSFRRHILVQYLILFQYLLSFTPAAKEKWKDWKNRNLQGLFVLEAADEQWVRRAWKDVLGLLREIPPNGRVFLEAVLEVLKREANWIRWKTESCPSIEKPPLSPEQIAAFANARAFLLRPPNPFPHPLGTAALSRLWSEGFPPPVPGTRRAENEDGNYVDVATDGLEELEFPPPIPSLDNYHSMIKRSEMKLNVRRRQLGIEVDATPSSAEDIAKEENDAECQKIREAMQSLAWRALRVASSEHLHLFKKMQGPENVPALMKAIAEERNPPPKPVEIKVEAVKAESEDKKEPAAAAPKAQTSSEKPAEDKAASASESTDEKKAADDEANVAILVTVPAKSATSTPAPGAAETKETTQPEAGVEKVIASKEANVDAATVEVELGSVEGVKAETAPADTPAQEDVEMTSVDKA